MNTKIKFYCIEISHEDITRYNIEAIVNLDLYSSPSLWLREIIPYICDTFDFDLLLDWKLIDYEETLEEISEPNIINTCSGKIIFDDDRDQKILLLKAENYEIYKEKCELLHKELQKYKEPSKVEEKDYKSCWIDLYGEIYYVGFAEHNSWADHYLRNHNPELYDEYGISFKRYTDAYIVLEEMGWIRILGWNNPPCFVLPNNITPKQKDSLREYCIQEKLKYKDFPEILKS